MNVSKTVKKLINEQPYLLSALQRGIIHFGNLALELKPKIEQELEKPVTESSVTMALRRYAEEVRGKINLLQPHSLDCEVTMKTNICDFNIIKTNTLLAELKSVYSLVDLESGDFLNITIGNREISIAISQKYREAIEARLVRETVLHRQDELVALTIVFSSDFFHTPGIIYQVLQSLAWQNVNLLEIVSTLTELTIVIERKDSVKSYTVLHDLIETFQQQAF